MPDTSLQKVSSRPTKQRHRQPLWSMTEWLEQVLVSFTCLTTTRSHREELFGFASPQSDCNNPAKPMSRSLVRNPALRNQCVFNMRSAYIRKLSKSGHCKHILSKVARKQHVFNMCTACIRKLSKRACGRQIFSRVVKHTCSIDVQLCAEPRYHNSEVSHTS